MPLRVYNGRATTPAGKSGIESETPVPVHAQPIPVLVNHTQHDGPAGPYVETTRVWRNEVGRRCRYCPSGCNFDPGTEGIGSCVTRKPGTLPEVAPAPASGRAPA
jgi:hypothetical protein